MKSYPELVLEVLESDNTPRTAAEIEAAIVVKTGLTPHPTAVHGALNALRRRPEITITMTEKSPRKYRLVAASEAVKTQAEINAEFERNLWAVRQGRGRA